MNTMQANTERDLQTAINRLKVKGLGYRCAVFRILLIPQLQRPEDTQEHNAQRSVKITSDRPIHASACSNGNIFLLSPLITRKLLDKLLFRPTLVNWLVSLQGSQPLFFVGAKKIKKQ